MANQPGRVHVAREEAARETSLAGKLPRRMCAPRAPGSLLCHLLVTQKGCGLPRREVWEERQPGVWEPGGARAALRSRPSGSHTPGPPSGASGLGSAARGCHLCGSGVPVWTRPEANPNLGQDPLWSLLAGC